MKNATFTQPPQCSKNCQKQKQKKERVVDIKDQESKHYSQNSYIWM